MKKRIALCVWMCLAGVGAFGQWSDGILLNVQEVNIQKMKELGMAGGEAVLKVVEQFVDSSYRYIYLSENYVLPTDWVKYASKDRTVFTVAVAGYPSRNNLMYVQVLYRSNFFFFFVAKNDSDLKRDEKARITRMNYEKSNKVRRENVRDTIQKQNVVPLGIER